MEKFFEEQGATFPRDGIGNVEPSALISTGAILKNSEKVSCYSDFFFMRLRTF